MPCAAADNAVIAGPVTQKSSRKPMVNPPDPAALASQAASERASPIASALAPGGAVQATLQAAWPELLAIYAFGSQVQGHANADSVLNVARLLPGADAGAQAVVGGARSGIV
jgi:hypothetical protein